MRTASPSASHRRWPKDVSFVVPAVAMVFVLGMLVGMTIMFTVYGGLRRTAQAVLAYMLERETSAKYIVVKASDYHPTERSTKA